MSDTLKIEALIDALRDCDETDNFLDVQIEAALFEPDTIYAAVQPNAAGTKLIYTRQDGNKETCWAYDYTMTRAGCDRAIATLTVIRDALEGDAS